MLKTIAALLYWLGLLALRAWYSGVMVFIGVAVARGALLAAREGDRSDALFGSIVALGFLSISLLLFLRAARQIDRVRSTRDAA